MAKSGFARSSLALMIAVLTLLALLVPSAAADDVVVFEPGIACAGFALQSESNLDVDMSQQISNPRGTVTHSVTVQAGEYTLTNLSTGESITEYLDGAVFHDRLFSDGTSRATLTGEFIVVLFPTDTPPGPSTRLYNGRMDYVTDAEGNWTVLSFRGTSVDLCAALAD